MAEPRHSKQTHVEGVHTMVAFEYADAAARTAAVLEPADIGKVARQLDTNQFWILQDDSPLTWQLFGAGAVLTATAPLDVLVQTAAAGVSAEAARSDHKHNISTAAPTQGIGGGNAVGSATSLARSNHDHALRETGGPTDLTIAAVADGSFVKRSGTTLVGIPRASPTMDEITSDTTTTAGSATPATLMTRSFSKSGSSSQTNLLITVNASGDSDTNDRATMIEIHVGGTRRAVAMWTSKNTGNRGNAATVSYLATGLSAGSVTVATKWWVEAGATAQIRPVTFPQSNYANMIIQEVPA